MPTEHEIRALCMRVFVAENSEQFNQALAELRAALRESIVSAHNLAIKMVLDNRSERAPLRPITEEQLENAADEVRKQLASKAAS